MNFRRLFAVTSTVIALLSAPASQASMVVDVDGTGLVTGCVACGAVGTTFGWHFTVHRSLQIKALAAWDAQGDGLGVATEVGLYAGTGDLLAAVTIDDNADRQSSTGATGDWLLGWITPLTLLPGDYLLGQVFRDGAPEALTSATYLADSRISITGGATSSQFDMGLAAPLDGYVEPVFGPSMLAVPEPGSLLVVSTALLALPAARRRR